MALKCTNIGVGGEMVRYMYFQGEEIINIEVRPVLVVSIYLHF
jgi:hypothetical protein